MRGDLHGVEAARLGRSGPPHYGLRGHKAAGVTCMADPAGMPWRRMAWKQRAWEGVGALTMDYRTQGIRGDLRG